jgi:hypothetical protein
MILVGYILNPKFSYCLRFELVISVYSMSNLDYANPARTHRINVYKFVTATGGPGGIEGAAR